MKTEHWKDINGYTEVGLFGEDDGSLMYKITKDVKKLCVVNLSAPLLHPNGRDRGYIEWKHKACRNVGSTKKGYYD